MTNVLMLPRIWCFCNKRSEPRWLLAGVS